MSNKAVMMEAFYVHTVQYMSHTGHCSSQINATKLVKLFSFSFFLAALGLRCCMQAFSNC